MAQPQIKTPAVLQVTVPATVTTPGFIATTMLDKERNQYYAASLKLEHMNVRLTSAAVSQMPVQKTMAPVLRDLLADANKDLILAHPLVRKWATGKPQRPVRQALIDNPDAATLSGAAHVYLLAKLSGEAPVKAVTRAAGVERDVARNWLLLARRNELL